MKRAGDTRRIAIVLAAGCLVACDAQDSGTLTDDGGTDGDAPGALDAPSDQGLPPDAFTPGDGPVIGPAPAWVSALTPGEWAAVSVNTIASVDPADDPTVNPNYPNSPPWRGNSGQAAVVSAWNGGALATGYGPSGSFVVWGGGHQDYYGNEVYAFDLATRAWSRVSNPYAGAITFPYADGMFPDGTPVPPHTYDQLDYQPTTNSLVVLRTMADNSPSNVPVAALFSFTTKTWRRSPRNTAAHHSSGGFSVYDDSRDVLWAEGGSGTTAFAQFDPNVNSNGMYGAWTNYSPKIGITDAVAARDPEHDIIVATAFRNGTGIFGIDLQNPDNAETTLVQGGAPPTRAAQHGWEWSYRRRAFLYYSSGDGVYEVKLDGDDWKTSAWTWSRLTAATNQVVPPEVGHTRVYGRFRIVRYADIEVAIMVMSTNGAVYAFRIP